jgi:hypothetical protein
VVDARSEGTNQNPRDANQAPRSGGTGGFGHQDVPVFSRAFFGTSESFSRIGEGEFGGKARGLVFIRDVIQTQFDTVRFPGIHIDIPRSVVLATDIFDAFMEQNRLFDVALSDTSDDRIALAFQEADLPVEIVGDLRALVEEVHLPLAVRSSSLLEDALFRPFAGIYETKMIPNNQPDPTVRFKRLVEAIKFVYSSVYSKSAKSYIRTTDKTIRDEKMAVLIQEVVGERWNGRFYPQLSGVARSYNFYPVGPSKPNEGVVNLALGLGKTVVDGGVTWAYSPAHPKAPPPLAGVSDLLKKTQVEFWAVNMGKPPTYDPTAETEYLIKGNLQEAEYDDTLRLLASTFDPRSERVVPGTGADGPRILNFTPILVDEEIPLNNLIKALLEACEKTVGAKVEIEFALTWPRGNPSPARFGFLQVRPMVVSDEAVEINDDEFDAPNLLAASSRVMGNGIVDGVRDVVYVKPDRFEARHTRAIAGQLEQLNRSLQDEGRPYLLIGFGRWGSADPWLGIPVDWGQICGAKVIVEATLPTMNVDPSQGSHFFHNISSFKVSYFSVRYDRDKQIDWEWLSRQETIAETEFVRQVRLRTPLRIKVDGRTGRGAIWS